MRKEAGADILQILRISYKRRLYFTSQKREPQMKKATGNIILVPIQSRRMRIFCDGRGKSPDGSGSGFAWVRPATNQKYAAFEDHLTNNQAEYLAICSAISAVAAGARVDILSDSALVVNQLKGNYKVCDPFLAKLRNKILAVVKAKQLQASFQWIPREQNLADRLLRRQEKD